MEIFMKVCTAAKMRNIDRRATEIGLIPSIVLMENAAIACVEEIKKISPRRVGIFCGKGNNGGDGICIARHLFNDRYDVEVFLVCGDDFSGDALINYEILKNTEVKITKITDTSLLEYYILSQDLIVDAIFGTGIHGPATGIAADVIKKINEHSKFTLSVDIPSGVSADTGDVYSEAVSADMTVTFDCFKQGMFLFPGADYMGEIILKNISIPQYIINGENITLNVCDSEFIKSLLPKREKNSQKGDYGKVFVVGASTGMTGAVTLCAKGALKSGAGLVTAGIPESLNDIIEVKLTEAMSLPLDEETGFLSEIAYMKIKDKMEQSDVLVFGPGAGRTEAIENLLSLILKNSKIPVIIDADGLYALSNNPGILDECNCNLILTPHEMEFARLVDKDIEYVKKNRLSLSRDFAMENGVTLVLKGHHTITTAPDGTQYINTTGNAGMATGGSGDVLSGMIAGFLASGLDETFAAVLAVHLHGLAGDIAKEKSCMESLVAGDILESIKDAIAYYYR